MCGRALDEHRRPVHESVETSRRHDHRAPAGTSTIAGDPERPIENLAPEPKWESALVTRGGTLQNVRGAVKRLERDGNK